MLIHDSLEKFYFRCVALNLQNKTIDSYQRTLNSFVKFLKENNIEEIEKITTDIIRQYLYQISKKIKKISVLTQYVIIKIYLNFLVSEDLLTINPISKIKRPKSEKTLIRSFTNKEIQILLNAFDKNDFLGFRNYIIMSCLFSTGVRKSELLNLFCTDIYFELDIINIVAGKGDKQRHVPISPILKKLLIKYLKKRQDYLLEGNYTESKYLFINRYGRRMTISGINCLFQKIKREHNLTGTKISAHTWRHTFSRIFLMNGGDVFTLQKILGHSDIATTKQYVNLNDNDIKIQNSKFNPLDNTRWQYY